MEQIYARAAGALTIALAILLASGAAIADDDKRGSSKDQRGYQHYKHNGGYDDHRGKRDDDDDDRGWSRNDDDDDDDDDRRWSRKGEDRDDDRRWSREGDRRYQFEDRHRVFVRDYYIASGCPPGLAKKGNRCVPPGQTRAWSIGRNLPPNLLYHDIPQSLALQFGQPPAGYRYVRVASDILLMGTHTGLIMDAILDLGGP